VPGHARARLRTALREATRRRGLRLLPPDPAPADGAWLLRGDFETFRDENGRRRLAYVFRLLDRKNRLVREISGTEPVREGTPDPWRGIDGIALPRMAETVAESLAAHFALQGYGTQGAGLPPPPDILVEAGPDAESEIDPDLLAGLPVPIRTTLLPDPEQKPPAAGTGPPPPARQPPARTATAPPAAPPRTRAPKPVSPSRLQQEDNRAKAAAKAADGREHIRSVAVLGVSGAPGNGNVELARALRRVLRRAGWPVHARRRADALLVRGRVLIDPPRRGRQRVRIIWTARTPKGVELGTVKQENIVPAGSLDKGFGNAAEAVAEGAAEGLFQLVARFRGGRGATIGRR
jgi:hypothetical protein